MFERELYAPIVSGAQRAGWCLFRINDGSVGRKPCDIVGCDGTGRGVMLEAKVVRGNLPTCIPWSLFEKHQKPWLQAFAQRGAIALVALYSTSTDKLTVVQITRHYVDQAIHTLPHVIMACKGDLSADWIRLGLIVDRPEIVQR